MYTHSTRKRVRYGETDQMGYLYYGRYALYYEIGRVELMRSVGVAYRYVEEELGVMMPVVSMHARYLRPARYDDEVTIATEVRELPRRRFTFHHQLYGPGGVLLNGGRVALCFVERASGRSVGCPAAVRDALQPFFA